MYVRLLNGTSPDQFKPTTGLLARSWTLKWVQLAASGPLESALSPHIRTIGSSAHLPAKCVCLLPVFSRITCQMCVPSAVVQGLRERRLAGHHL